MKSPTPVLKNPTPIELGLAAESVREQLQKIVASRIFQQSKKLVRFLGFVVEKALEGKGDQLSEYLIGVEVYERSSSFDPQIDTIVRGEARRLRSKLRQYYDTDGAYDPILIEVPKGAYAAVFHQRERGVLDKNVGQSVSHYRLVEKLGEGGMGAVYLAEDTQLGRRVALKFIAEALLKEKDSRSWFLREAQAAASIDHPNVATVYEVGTSEGHPFIAMAHVKGQSLEDRIAEGLLEIRDALNIACQLADGLEAAHRQGIVHRDLKPANVILEEGGRIRIIDFGLAQLAAVSRLTQASTPIGTANYISPEQMIGEVVDQRADIWSLGVILYELATGRKPFQAEHREAVYYAIAHVGPEPMRRWRADIPEELERVVFKCLEKRPAQRYADAAALRAELLAIQSEGLRPQGGPPSSPPLSRGDDNKMSPRQGTTLGRNEDEVLPADTLLASPSKFLGQTGSWVVGAAVAVLLTVAGMVWRFREDRKQPALPVEVKRLTFDSALALHPAVSPDGRYLAFASDRAGEGNLDIWVQSLPTGEPVRLTRDAADEDFPAFSPDGNKIAFQSERDGRAIYSIPILGGEPRLLTQNGSLPRYSPDGQRLSFTLPYPASGQQHPTTRLFLMPAEGGERTEFPTGFFYSSNPIWSPDASQLLYAGEDHHSASETVRLQLAEASLGSAWYVAPVSGGPPVRIDPSAQFARFLGAFPVPLAWLRSNRILFSHASGDAMNLWVATLSPDHRRIIGSPEQLTFGTSQITNASVTASGAVVFSITATRPRLWEIPLETGKIKDNGDPMAVVTNRDFTGQPSLSDTGKLAYLAQTSDNWNLWLRDLPSGKETLLTSMEGGGDIDRVTARINRAGTRVAYAVMDQSKSATIYTIGAEGGTSEKICADCGLIQSWSRDGRMIFSQQRVLEGSKWVATRINRIEVANGRKVAVFEKTNYFVFGGELSPDGQWVTFQGRATLADRKEQLFIAQMSDDSPVDPERWVPLTGFKYFDASPNFSRDGKLIYFYSDRDGFTCLWAVRLNPATKKPAADPYPLKHFHGNPRYYSWYPQIGLGSDRIIISLEQIQSDLWMTQLPEED
ncbi:MAG TPA: protein kinase [Terriglobia bacterium]|nr:protein kinase [Terriglobia bacterium]